MQEMGHFIYFFELKLAGYKLVNSPPLVLISIISVCDSYSFFNIMEKKIANQSTDYTKQ
jgi:hypothetical protein